MSDPYSQLPKYYTKLSEVLPDGFVVSRRIIDPIILIERSELGITARLAGRRLVKGKEEIYPAPSNFHNWVLDKTIVRPLPNDTVDVFSQMFGPKDNNLISYTDVRRHLELENSDIELRLSQNTLASGSATAAEYPDEISIEGLMAKLYPYQAKGVKWMWEVSKTEGGLILADEMGLGKTLQIIALLLLEVPKTSSPALIICPTSLIVNWVREIEKFAPSLTVLVHRGAERTGIYKGLQETNIVITTYDTMVNDISIFSAFEWSWVVCDEAQAIKNPHSIRRQSVATIPRNHTIPMTGTPVENSLVDLWSLADFAVPGILGSLSEFEARYPDGIDTAKEISEIVEPLMLKRRVADVAGDLPPRIDIDIPLEMENELVSHYNAVREATLKKYPVAGALVATLQLQLVCSHPWLRQEDESDEEGEDAVIDPAPGLPLMNAKMDRARSLIGEAFSGERKVIVFAMFNRMGGLLREACQDLPSAYWGAINGSTPSSERQSIIDTFSSHKGPAILVLNPKAAGAGLNITAATVVIHLTPVWNPALEAQASARAYRRGQELPVTIYRLFYEDTIERVMLDRSTWKNAMGNEITPTLVRDKGDLEQALLIQPRKQ
ncbi:SNF2 family DNA or RNA helicase [Yoonia maritima]|uniref:SNF2 family DNA or RNA helicase n=1 Tax=Yoonia maritima TaxID=1435347 RepID=A0A2T0VUX1_9RHOB|nr:DEAD/DEAH box helicase [Yoonia maritima]PRY75306.1 SNF2 family DNA or RNA helicase [Yoonia maritima]